MQLFYNSELKSTDKNFCFDKKESRHINKVLRKKIQSLDEKLQNLYKHLRMSNI